MSFNKNKLFLDIGSTNSKIYLNNKEIFHEPTCIAYHKTTKSVVAVGQKALSLLGKAPKSIVIGFPVQYGSIANTKYFELFISSVLERLLPNSKINRLIFGLRGKVAVMSSLSLAKKRLLKNILKKVGFTKIDLIDSPYVRAISIFNGDKKQLDNICIIDIGSQKTEIAVFSMGELINSQSFKWGGMQFTELLQKIVKVKHQCVVGWHLAEEAKKQIGTLQKNKSKFVLRGKDVVSQASKTIVLNSEDLRLEYSKLFDELMIDIQNFIATLPSEIAVSILDKGIFLAGGGSLLKGINKAIFDRLKCDVYLSNDFKKKIIDDLII